MRTFRFLLEAACRPRAPRSKGRRETPRGPSGLRRHKPRLKLAYLAKPTKLVVLLSD